MIDVHRIVTGSWKENCYVVADGADAVIVDPGGEFDRIVSWVEDQGLRVHAVVNTHAHYDHLGAVVPLVRHYGVAFHLHPADENLLHRANFYRRLFLGQESIEIPTLDVALAGGETLQFGGLALDVVHTPGHTPGSVCFAAGGLLFTGDTIMAEHLGRTDLPGGDRDALVTSVALLAGRFDEATPLHPGHGRSIALADVLPRVTALPELR